MKEIIERNEDFTRKEVSKAEALELFKNAGLELKLLNDDPILFVILEQVGEIESYKLIEKIKKNYK